MDNGNGKVHNDRRGWAIGREIPVAVIITFVGMTAAQILSGYLVVRDLSIEVVQQGKKLDVLDTKVDTLASTVVGGQVPSAINARRIEELERIAAQQATLIAQGLAKINENDRRLTALEVRQRALRER